MVFIILLFSIIPYPNQPNWESIDSDYSTGGALVDVDLDGDLDFITGNGNDMAQNRNKVNYNYNDTLQRIAGWQSSDVGYNAHISLGDINYDGYPDLAVANYGDPYTPQYDKFYYNFSGTFQSSSSWRPHDRDNSFACALGDMDGDGDLDLAVACGESYGDSAQKAKVYLNQNGIFDTMAIWESNIASYFYDVAWVDIDNDGDLDLGLAAELGPNLIYRNTNGILESMPYWYSANSLNTLKLAFGDIDNDGDLDMVCANNGQLGGQSNCQLYLNNGTNLSPNPSWTSQNLTYYSCVALGDVDQDGDLDLAAGGWWESVKVFENLGGTFPLTPSWQWSPSNPYQLVCENIVFGDVDNNQPAAIINEPHIVTPTRRVFYLNKRWIRNITRVRRSSGDLNRNQYCFSYTDGWLSIANIITQPETIWVDYTYSKNLDLLVTNWHQTRGNFLFLNTLNQGIAQTRDRELTDFHFSNPNNGNFVIRTDLPVIRIQVFDASGRMIQEQNGKKVEINAPGVYFIKIYYPDNQIWTEKLVVIK
ncbi:MAG: T9SS type A sorting domain-containing protein [candidate division WOR-3 bacterium]